MAEPEAAAAADVAVPPIDGASLREAVRALHESGLRVRLHGRGSIVESIRPEPGTALAAGSTIDVWTNE